ncbi:MAG: VWA domain-containing protein [Blastocatellia bacterium]
MKRYDFARWLIVFTLMAGIHFTFTTLTAAQSGRKRPPAPPSQGPRIETQDGKSPGRGEEKPADRPLSDSTPTEVSDDGTIKLDTFLVTIPVSVTDQSGKFVPDLVKREFHVFEDGVEQEIESFESVETPFHVALVIDTSNSTRFRLEDIQDAAVGFVNQLRPDDEVMVVSFDSDVKIECEFTSDRRRLRDAIFQTRTGGSTKLYEAVDQVLDRWMSRIQGRKAVVLFTDGVDTSSRRANAQHTLGLAEESDTIFYPIRYDTELSDPSGVIINRPGQLPPIFRNPWPTPNPRTRRRWPLTQWVTPQWPQGRWPAPGGGRGGGTQAGDYRRGAQYLQDLADRTGGRLYQADTLDSVSRAFTQIADELRHQYRLSYYPTNSRKDGAWRKIKVRVDRPSLAVRSRDGYKAAMETQASVPEQQPDGERPRMKRKQNLAVK